MKQKLGIFTTSLVNKYGYRFSIESIENAFLETWGKGRPMFISHEYLLNFGKNKGAFIAKKDHIPLGLEYIPKYVLSNEQIEALNNGLKQLIK